MEFFATDQGRFLLLGVAAALVGVTVWILRRTRSSPRRTVRVIGVGGAGANAIDAVSRAGLRDVEYVAVDTDLAALNRSSARTKIAIGRSITAGLSAGGDVGAGESAARDAAEAVGKALEGSDLVVIVAGLGGGTGSGAAPVIAEVASGLGVLTLAVVTKPFGFEGFRKARVARDAEAALAGLVDAVATIPNDQVRTTAAADITVEDAFHEIDKAIHQNVAGIVEMMAVAGRINLDFADARAVLGDGGAATMGFGRAAGETRATDAARAAIDATHLDEGIRGARSVLVNVSGSRKLRLKELDAVAEAVLAATGRETNLIFGVGLRQSLQDELQVAIIATRGTGGAASEARAPSAVATAESAAPDAPEAESAEPVALGQSTSPRVRATDIAATVLRASDPHPVDEIDAVPEPDQSPDSNADDWRPVWLRRTAPPGTPAPDAQAHRSQAAGESRRERRKRARTDRSAKPDEGV